MRKTPLLAASLVLLSPSLLVAKPANRSRLTRLSVLSYVQTSARASRKYHMQASKWSLPQWNASKYIGVTFGEKQYVYDWNRKFIKITPSRWPTAGIIGNYVETGWEPLNRKMERYSDLGGSSVLRFTKGKFQLVGWDNSADGYGDSLTKSEVPARVIKRLRRWVRVDRR